MTASLLDDVFAHHIWATERLIDECSALTPEQLAAPAPGTYGSIIDTFRHLVSSDGWYLSFLREQPAPIDEEADVTLAELRAAITANGVAWKDLLAAGPDGEADIAEHGDRWGAHGAASSLGARALPTAGVPPGIGPRPRFGQPERRTARARPRRALKWPGREDLSPRNRPHRTCHEPRPRRAVAHAGVCHVEAPASRRHLPEALRLRP